jgi:SAM-dependent methyltransferase
MSEPSRTYSKDDATDYDGMIDWESRLAREGPFFRDLFEAADVRRVADLGCGTGRHAIEFSRWGLDVVCIDPSEEMLERARGNAEAAAVPLDLRRGGFGELSGLFSEPVDAVACLGNAFAHVGGPEGALAALTDIAAV